METQQEVEVLIADEWVPGWLESWREKDGRGEGFVWYAVHEGPKSSTHRAEWYDEDEIRAPELVSEGGPQ